MSNLQFGFLLIACVGAGTLAITLAVLFIGWRRTRRDRQPPTPEYGNTGVVNMREIKRAAERARKP